MSESINIGFLHTVVYLYYINCEAWRYETLPETSDLSDTFYFIGLFISALFYFFLKTNNWNSL